MLLQVSVIPAAVPLCFTDSLPVAGSFFGYDRVLRIRTKASAHARFCSDAGSVHPITVNQLVLARAAVIAGARGGRIHATSLATQQVVSKRIIDRLIAQQSRNQHRHRARAKHRVEEIYISS
jgi:hypothetical protein